MLATFYLFQIDAFVLYCQLVVSLNQTQIQLKQKTKSKIIQSKKVQPALMSNEKLFKRLCPFIYVQHVLIYINRFLLMMMPQYWLNPARTALDMIVCVFCKLKPILPKKKRAQCLIEFFLFFFSSLLFATNYALVSQ